MVCRGLMLLFDREGFITLPPKKRELPWLLFERSTPSPEAVDMTPIVSPFCRLSPLDVRMVRRTPEEKLYQSLM